MPYNSPRHSRSASPAAVSPLPADAQSASSGLGIPITHPAQPHSRTMSTESFPGPRLGAIELPAHQSDPLLSPPLPTGLSNSTNVNTPATGLLRSQSPKPSLCSNHSYELRSICDNSRTRLNLNADTSYSHAVKPKITSLRQRGWCSWISLSTLVLTLYSTVFSGIFLAIALRAPHYGRIISAHGSLTAATAALLTSLFAKTIEMTFVTAMLAVLGQELSRRAYGKSRWQGVSIAEIGMRSWIVQPGTLISRWESVRYAGITLLGILSLVATLVATLYTPAATALVQPQLRVVDWEVKSMQAAVKTSFANPEYIATTCNTPISKFYDPQFYGSTCESIEYAASGYYNFFQYLAQWNSSANASSGSTNPKQRPNGTALILGDIIVTAPWIEVINMTAAHEKSGLVVNNVSLALPHAGIVAASRDDRNGILQPGELDGLGAYQIVAALPSPVMHVMCVTLSRNNLAPLVYELWNDAELPVNMTIWPSQIAGSDKYLNGTPLDSLFGWGPDYGEVAVPPLFPKLPMRSVTIMNFTSQDVEWGRDSIYLLGCAGVNDTNNQTVFGDDYSLCQLKISQTTNCSTRFNAAASGNTLSAHCEDSRDEMAYHNFLQSQDLVTPSSSGVLDWPNVALEWAAALSLTDGSFDGYAAIEHFLTEQTIRRPTLLPNMPSIAESLAVLAANTLLQSTFDAPVVPFWNLTVQPPDILNESVYQWFPAKVQVQEYASGGSVAYHRAFYPVLIIMFLLDLIALVYLVLRREWLVDLSEPQTLLSLAVSNPASPPDHIGEDNSIHKEWRTNPKGRELDVGWAVKQSDTGVVIQRTPQFKSGNTFQELRHRMSSHFTSLTGSSKTVSHATFQPISNE